MILQEIKTLKLLSLIKVFAITFIAYSAAFADEVDVEHVEIASLGQGDFRVDVTLRHDDTGWEHYANQWNVLDETGAIIGTRVLHHPHVNEQPFTRSLTLKIPKSVNIITIQAHDLVHKTGGITVNIEVPHG